MSKIHIVGAGVAGLSAAVRLASSGRQIFLYESAGHAGGRCRSYFDNHLGCRIDNGNHLLLSGNPSVHEYLRTIGASRELIGPKRAIFPFIDLSVSKRWTVEIGKSSFPLWLLKKDRRIPDTGISDYLSALRLLFADEDQNLGDIVDTHAPLYHRFFEPFAVGVLNTPAEVSSARLLATVLKETFARGADACMPRMAKVGLSETFVDPALTYLKERGVVYRDNTRLREIVVEAQRTTQLRFSNSEIEMSRDDIVVLATPAPVTATLVPDLTVPVDTYPIVNAHFRVPDKVQLASDAGLIGIVGGTAQWLFFRGDIISATVSAADRISGRTCRISLRRFGQTSLGQLTVFQKKCRKNIASLKRGERPFRRHRSRIGCVQIRFAISKIYFWPGLDEYRPSSDNRRVDKVWKFRR